MGIGLGVLAGAGYRHPFYEELKLKMQAQQQQMLKRKMVMEEVKMLGEELQLGKASIPYYQEKLNEFAEGHYKKMGDWMTKNPDYRLNPSKFVEYTQMKNQLKDNQYTRRSEDLQNNMDLAYASYEKNPDLMEQEAFRSQFEQMRNQKLTGSADGIEGNDQQWSFTPVENWEDFSKTSSTYAAQVKRRIHIANDFGMQEDIHKEDAEHAIKTLYLENKEQVDSESAKLGMTPQDYILNSVKKGLALNFTPWGKNNRHPGAGGSGGSGGSGIDAVNFDVDFSNPSGQAPTEFTDKWVGTSGQVHIIDPSADVGDMNNLKHLGGVNIRNYRNTGKWINGGKDANGQATLFWEVETAIPFDEAKKIEVWKSPWLAINDVADPRYMQRRKGNKALGEDEDQDYIDIRGYVMKNPTSAMKRGYEQESRMAEDKGAPGLDVKKEVYTDESTGKRYLIITHPDGSTEAYDQDRRKVNIK